MSEPKNDKPILCLDFDGVIHKYSKGWQDGAIYDPPTEGFFDWAHGAGKLFKLVIYSSRSKTEVGIDDMQQWLVKHAWAEGWQMTDIAGGDELVDGQPSPMRLLHARDANVLLFFFAHEKPPAYLTIDDRCVRFNGSWDALDPHTLREFKPWNAA
jgi:hypothetical protein